MYRLPGVRHPPLTSDRICSVDPCPDHTPTRTRPRSAPTPAQVIEVAEQCSGQLNSVDSSARGASLTPSTSRYLLVDTFTKDGRGLLDWIGLPELAAVIEHAAQTGRLVVLAGSLAQQDLPKLWDLPVAAIAVRGAVCAADRRSEVCAQKLQQWVELFRNR